MLKNLCLKGFLAAAGLLAAACGANAALMYGNIAAPGVYFGSGNVNGNWTIDNSNGVEVALRIKDRATLATIDGSSGIYQANAGLCNPLCSGAPKAAWNYEFSVNTQAGGGTLDLTDVFVVLEVDQDASLNTNWVTLNVLNNWVDNNYWNGTRRIGQSPVAGEYGVQQSANPLFGDSGFGFLPGPGLYDLRLSVLDSNGVLLAQTATQVQVQAPVAVPEPGSLALVGAAAFGLAALRRRRT